MHIAYFAPAWPPAGAANGIVTYVSVIRDYLLARGHDVSVVSGDHLHRSDGSIVELDAPSRSTRFWPRMAARLDRRLGHHPFTGRRMMQQLRRVRRSIAIDLVEMEESFGWSASVARGLDIPVVTRLHGPQFLKPAGVDRLVDPRHARDRERAEGRAIRAAAMLSAPTRAMLDTTCRHYRRSDGAAKVIPNPVVPVAEDARWRLADCDHDLILFVGRLDRLKGADTLIAAFARVLAERPTARLDMVGPDGTIEQADGTMTPFVDHARSTLPPDVFARIRFTGLLAPEAIRAMRRRAYVTVVASVNENFPYAAVEAMSAGSPLVATEWLGSRDVVADGVDGWLTPVGDAAAMARRISWVFANPDAASAAGAMAWRHCRDVYAVEQVGEQMISFYQDIVARHSA